MKQYKKHRTNDTKHSKYKYMFLILNFRCVLYVVCFLLGNFLTSELIQTPGNYPEENIQKVYIFPKHPRITKQFKTTTVQVKTNTVQGIPKCNSHSIIKYPQYKVTLMYMALLSPRTSP